METSLTLNKFKSTNMESKKQQKSSPSRRMSIMSNKSISHELPNLLSKTKSASVGIPRSPHTPRRNNGQNRPKKKPMKSR